jgi:NAD(P)-dependent dehydrogenase (short-subunit alcohol dehydrogenase family)
MMSERSVAIVTGAGSGIGRAVAQALGEQAFRLALVGRNADKLQSTADSVPEAFPIVADLSEPDAALLVVDETADRWGRVDVLVNNAGVAPLVPIDEMTDTLLNDTFAINAFAPIRLVAAAWSIFRRQESGCVVNVSSMAVADPFPGFSVYAASKGAVDALTRSVINEGRVYGIRAFSVAPGAVETPLLRASFSAQAIPPTATLDPRDVAQVVVDCIQGRREADLGQTILLPSP